MADGPNLLVCQVDMAEANNVPQILQFSSYAERQEWVSAHAAVTGHGLYWMLDAWPTQTETIVALAGGWETAKAVLQQHVNAVNTLRLVVNTLAPEGTS